MPKLIENDTWKHKPTDIAYKEPFSDSTNKARKLLVFWASITLLNHFYPIDLENSHVLGLKFSQGIVPPLDALLGLIVIYLTITLTVYVYQETKSWLAQANEVALDQYRRSLHDIHLHHTGIKDAVNSAAKQIENHANAILKLTAVLENNSELSQRNLEQNLNELNVHKESFENVCRRLGDSNEQYGEEVEKTTTLLEKTESDFKAALRSQLLKVGVLEVLVPFLLGLFSVIVSLKAILHLIWKAIT